MDPRSLQYHDSHKSLGDRYFNQFKAMCAATPARKNALLQLHLLGRVRDLQTVPAYLTEIGFKVVREQILALSLNSELGETLQRRDRFSLYGIVPAEIKN